MRRITRVVSLFRCEKCGAEYPTMSEARRCEAGTCERKQFRIGDFVRARERRCCSLGRSYVMKGRVVAIVGPEPYDAEVLLKGFGVPKTHGHFFWYEVSYCCPVCRRSKRARYPAGALTLLRRKRRS